jgi:hypothetical protein
LANRRLLTSVTYIDITLCNNLEAAVKPIDPIPYKEPLFSTAQSCSILAVKRNTLAGQLARYDHQLRQIGIEPGAQGIARSFTLEQLGLFAVIRASFSLGQAEAVFEALSKIAPHAERLYSELASGVTAETRSWRDGRVEEFPELPLPSAPAHLEGHNLFGQWAFKPERKPYSESTVSVEVLDTAGYPLPILILPLDRTLRYAWNRAYLVHHKLSLPHDVVAEAAAEMSA